MFWFYQYYLTLASNRYDIIDSLSFSIMYSQVTLFRILKLNLTYFKYFEERGKYGKVTATCKTIWDAS